MRKQLLVITTVSLLLTSCASIFIPKKQKVSFTTDNNKSEVYVDKEQIGTGENFTTKLNTKDGQSRQVVLRKPGYKDQYSVLVKERRTIACYPLTFIDWLTFYGGYYDVLNYAKLTSYPKKYNLTENEDNRLVTKGDKDKFINISNIGVSNEYKDKFIGFYHLKHTKKDLVVAVNNAEKKQDDKIAKQESKEEKKLKRKGKDKVKTLTEDDDGINSTDTKFSTNIYKTLKKTGFIDTVNVIFKNSTNTLILEGSIKKVNTFTVSGKYHSYYYKSKVYLTWYIKNTYGEILDSVKTNEFSGEYSTLYTSSYENGAYVTNYDDYYKMVADAIDISYLKLHKNPTFKKHLKTEESDKTNDKLLTLSTPNSKITDKSDASLACVTVKVTKKEALLGHGSGFAITDDGYILTNYHVIASKILNQPNDITIITSNSEEYKAKIVRVNKDRDVALLKIDAKFEKAFKLNSSKNFKPMQDIFTIGTPKSIELGQTVSLGIISNQRESENTNLLQLSMSVNSGNSGGPVFDPTGTLHGLIVSKLVGKNVEGVSFAVPSYMIEKYLNIKYN